MTSVHDIKSKTQYQYGSWSQDEHQKFVDIVKEYGLDWRRI